MTCAYKLFTSGNATRSFNQGLGDPPRVDFPFGWDTPTMASEIVVALIGGGAGMATGVVGSLFAPWANWGVEKRRLARQRRIERIEEWRAGVAELLADEHRHGVPVRRLVPLHEQGNIAAPPRYEMVVPHHGLINLLSKSWWGTLKLELSDHDRRELEALNSQPIEQRIGVLPQMLTEQINDIERNVWELLGHPR